MGTFRTYIEGVERQELNIIAVTVSYIESDFATLELNGVRHDELPAWLLNNARVTIKEDGTTVFDGRVRVNEPGGVAKEGATFRAYGARYFLDKEIICRINGSATKEWMPNGSATDAGGPLHRVDRRWTVGEALLDIFEHARGIPLEGTALPEHHENPTDVHDTYLSDEFIASYDAADIKAKLDVPLPTYALSGPRPLGLVITDLVTMVLSR